MLYLSLPSSCRRARNYTFNYMVGVEVASEGREEGRRMDGYWWRGGTVGSSGSRSYLEAVAQTALHLNKRSRDPDGRVQTSSSI